jgi:ankyrin repeat protein
MNSSAQISILQYCAEQGFEDIPTVEQFLRHGVGIDEAPAPDTGSPFARAVTNSCFRLASLLLERGANPNLLYRHSLGASAHYPTTLLGFLAVRNTQGSISGLDFLLQERPNMPRINLITRPVLNYTVFHTLATLSGDAQDSLATSLALSLCTSYFRPRPADLNRTSFRKPSPDGSVEDEGGNTALHLAVIKANFEVVKWLLKSVEGVDVSIRNSAGFTALELAEVSCDQVECHWVPRDVPKHPRKQMDEAKRRRMAILRLLERVALSAVGGDGEVGPEGNVRDKELV